MDRVREMLAGGYHFARMQLASAGYWADVMVEASTIEAVGPSEARSAFTPTGGRWFERDVDAELRRRRRSLRRP
jgi:hypothetical protein